MQHRRATRLIVFALLLSASRILAQSPSFSWRAAFGASHLPLSHWSDFFRALSDNDAYEKDDVTLYPELALHYHLNKHHTFGLGTELIKTFASAKFSMPLFDENGNVTGFSPFRLDWKFQGIPISINYEYAFSGLSRHFRPAAGIGASYFVSKVEARTTGSFLPEQHNERTGRGYGVHAYLAVHTQIFKRLGLISRARYRYSDGMAFTDKPRDVKIEFTSFDFSFGLGWSI